MNRIAIFRLPQCGISQIEIRKLLNVSKALTSKCCNYEKIEPKKIGRPQKFSDEKMNLFLLHLKKNDYFE